MLPKLRTSLAVLQNLLALQAITCCGCRHLQSPPFQFVADAGSTGKSVDMSTCTLAIFGGKVIMATLLIAENSYIIQQKL
jgi:hypothetical protein